MKAPYRVVCMVLDVVAHPCTQVFLLSFGSWLFVGISRRLVVAPIERMYKVVDIVSVSLNTLQKAETVEEDGDDDDALFETSFLEEAIRKMADLLNMG